MIFKPLLNLEKNILEEISTKFLIPTEVCEHNSIFRKELFDERYLLWEGTHLYLGIAAQFSVVQLNEYRVIEYFIMTMLLLKE